MKKAVTRILSLFLIVTMLTSADVFSVFAENGEAEESAEGITPHSGVDGDLTWSIDENGVLRITGLGIMKMVTGRNIAAISRALLWM